MGWTLYVGLACFHGWSAAALRELNPNTWIPETVHFWRCIGPCCGAGCPSLFPSTWTYSLFPAALWLVCGEFSLLEVSPVWKWQLQSTNQVCLNKVTNDLAEGDVYHPRRWRRDRRARDHGRGWASGRRVAISVIYRAHRNLILRIQYAGKKIAYMLTPRKPLNLSIK